MMRVARYTAVICLTLIAVYLVWFFRSIVAVLLLSLVVAAALRPFVINFDQRQWPRVATLAVVYGTVIVGIVGLTVGFGLLLIDEIELIVNNFIFRYEALWKQPAATLSAFEALLVSNVPNPVELYDMNYMLNRLTQTEGWFGSLSSLTNALASIPLVLAISIYWSTGQNQFERLWLSLLSASTRITVRDAWREAEMEIGRFVRTELTYSLLAFVLIFPPLWLLRMPFAATIAFSVALLRLLSLLGIPLAFLTTVLLTISLGWLSLLVGLAVVGIVLLIHSRSTWRMAVAAQHNPILLVMMLIVQWELLGVIGLVLAPMSAAVIQIVTRKLYQAMLQQRETFSKNEQLHQLHQRAEAIRMRFAVPDSPTPIELDNLITRLDSLLAQSKREILPHE